MPARDWIKIRASLITNFNPTVSSAFMPTHSSGSSDTLSGGASQPALSDADKALMALIMIQPNDSSLIAQTRITLFNQKFPASTDAYAVCPDGWLIRPEYHRPQGIYQFVEVDDTGKVIGSPKYRVTIPHHKLEKLDVRKPAPIDNYQRGNWEIIYVLSDNSKITVHSKDEKNGLKVLEQAKALVDPKYLETAYQSKSCLVPTKQMIAQITVKCRMAKFYSTGCLNVLPDWIVKW